MRGFVINFSASGCPDDTQKKASGLTVGVRAGRRYRDDPTIFGWDLINEPRCNCFPKKLPPIAEWDNMDGPCSPKCADKITVRLACMLLPLRS